MVDSIFEEIGMFPGPISWSNFGIVPPGRKVLRPHLLLDAAVCRGGGGDGEGRQGQGGGGGQDEIHGVAGRAIEILLKSKNNALRLVSPGGPSLYINPG